MSDGEKMVWAAVFARHFDISEVPPSRMKDRAEWESEVLHQAVECAAGAVEAIRQEKASVRKGWGNDFVADALDEMLR